MSSKEIKQKIILMTIECIEQEGIQSATVRKIADMAEVNVAAINYYFGSKKQLFEIVMNTNLNESFVNNINDYEGMWNTDTHKALNNFLGDTLEGAVNYPNLTKAHFNEVFNKNNFESNSVQRLNNFLREFYELTRSELKQDDDLKSRIAISQLFSSILIIGMMPDLFKKFLNIDLKDKINQQIFVQSLLDNFCK